MPLPEAVNFKTGTAEAPFGRVAPAGLSEAKASTIAPAGTGTPGTPGTPGVPTANEATYALVFGPKYPAVGEIPTAA